MPFVLPSPRAPVPSPIPSAFARDTDGDAPEGAELVGRKSGRCERPKRGGAPNCDGRS